MMNRNIEMAYRRSALDGATSVGLTVALYDTLAGDLRRAAEAIRAGKIEQRCLEINHAITVLGYLESWIDLANGEALARSLTNFYRSVRQKMMEAQMNLNSDVLDEQMALVLELRGSWQHVDEGKAREEANGQAAEQANGESQATATRYTFPISAYEEGAAVGCRWSA